MFTFVGTMVRGLVALAVQTWSNIDSILKDDYQKGVWMQLNQETPFLRLLQKSSRETKDTGGRKAVFALKIGAHQGTRSYENDPTTFKTVGKTNYGDAEVKVKRVYHQLEIPNEVVKLADTSTDAFTNALQDEMETLVKSLKQRLNEMLLNGSEDGIQLVLPSASTDATPTYAVAYPWNVTTSDLGVLLRKMNLYDMEFDCYDPTLTTQRGGAGVPRTVVDFDDTEGSETLTFDVAFAGAVDDDVLIRSDEIAQSTNKIPHFMGLKGIIDDFTEADPFEGVTGSTPAGRAFRANALRNGGTKRPMTEELMNRLYSLSAINGGEFPDLYIGHPYTIDTYASTLTPDKRYMARREVRLPGGYKRDLLTHNGIAFLPEPDLVRNRLYAMHWKGITLFHRDGPIGEWMSNKGGGILERIPRTPYHEAVYCVFANMGTKHRPNHTLLDDLEEVAI